MCGIPDRHRSMRAVFDHSWQLLSENERRVLMGLSVFRGGFHREAAEQVVGTSLHILSTLVDKSILNVNSIGRYGIHELQRQYAEEWLNKKPELQTTVRDRHCEYYCEFMNQPVTRMLGSGNNDVLQRIESEINNVRSAWDWAVEHKQVSNLKKALYGLYWFSWLRSWHEEGERAIRRAVEALRETEPGLESNIVLGETLAALSAMCIWLGRGQEISEHITESVSILRRLDAQPELAKAVGVQGWLAATQQNWEAAKPLLKEAAALAEDYGLHAYRGFHLSLLGEVADSLGESEEAEDWYRQALLLGRRIGDQRTIADALLALGGLAQRRGQYLTARHLYKEGLVVAQAAEIAVFTIGAFQKLGAIAEMIGELDVARDHLEASLRVARDDGKAPNIAWSLVSLANVLVVQGEYELARKHYEEALEIPPGTADRARYGAVLGGLAKIAFQTGHYAEALQHYEASLALYREIGDRAAIANKLASIARIRLAQGENTRSRPLLLESLREGIDIDSPSIILNTMIGIAEMFMRQGDLTSAASLATFIIHHPTSTASTKERVESLVVQAEGRLLVGDPHTDYQQIALDTLDEVATRLVEQLESLIEQPLVEPLSERELEVLRLIASGKSNREIARTLTLTLGTVKSHIHHIMQKLDASNRTDAVTRAREYRLL